MLSTRACRVVQSLLITLTFVLGSESIVGIGQDELGPVEGAAIAYSPDGEEIAYATGPSSCSEDDLGQFAIHIIDAITWAPIRTLTRHQCIVNTLSWSSDSTKLLSNGEDSRSFIWNVETGEVITTYQGNPRHFPPVSGSWRADGQLVADFSKSSSALSIWSPSTGLPAEFLTQPNDAQLASFSWSTSSNLLAVNNSSGLLQFWDTSDTIQTGVSELQASYADMPANVMRWSPNDALIALANNSSLTVVSSTSGQIVRSFSGHTGTILSVVWSPDASRIASGGTDNTIRVWDVNTGTELATFSSRGMVRAIDWNPLENEIAYVGRGLDPNNPVEIEIPPQPIPSTSTPTASPTPKSVAFQCRLAILAILLNRLKKQR